MTAADEVRSLAGAAGAESAERLIADAQAGGWLPDLVDWVRAWARGNHPFRCRVCGGPTSHLCSACNRCLARDEC